MTKVPVVNENDELIGYKEREELALTDIYRVSALWLVNSRGQVLLAQRGFNKSHDPGKWGPAVAGTVEEGEDYESNMVKETAEELGLTGLKMEKSLKLRRRKHYQYFCQWYEAIVDKPAAEFKVQKDEVAAIRWFDVEELKKDIEENPQNYLEGVKEYLTAEL